MKSYERNFNFADAAGDIFFVYAQQQVNEQELAEGFIDPANPPAPFTAKCHCSDSTKCDSDPNSDLCGRTLDKRLGNFYARAQLMGYSTDPEPGWEPGAVTAFYWKGLGQTTPPDVPSPKTSPNTVTATVELAVKKLEPN